MFGSNLPVCAIDFACLNELVQDGVNGFVFQDGQQLASQVRLKRGKVINSTLTMNTEIRQIHVP